MKCKKCNAQNVSVQVINGVSRSSTSHKGGVHAINRLCLILLTCGLWLLVPKKKETTKYKNNMQKIAICNNCGHSWKL